MSVVATRGIIGNYLRFLNKVVTANTNIFTTNLEMNYEFSRLCINITPTLAGSVSLVRTYGETTVVEKLNAGAALAAGSNYEFTTTVGPDETINIRYSVADTLLYLNVYELL